MPEISSLKLHTNTFEELQWAVDGLPRCDDDDDDDALTTLKTAFKKLRSLASAKISEQNAIKKSDPSFRKFEEAVFWR